MSWQLLQHHQGISDPPLALPPGSVLCGRGQTAHLRSNDQSVSRVHAELVIAKNAGSLSDVCPPEISLIDRSSTGHTFVNEQKTPGKGVPVKLKDGDVFTFGVDPHQYTVRWRPILISVSSRLSGLELQSLEDQARGCGVFLTSEWTPQCTHLLIEQWAITPKLLCCVIDGASPVAASFLDSIARRDELRPPPSAASCSPAPPVGADAAYVADLDAYASCPAPRRDLLRGSWIIFSAKQAYDTLSLPLEHAGASKLLLTQDTPVASMIQDLKRGVATHGAPSEVWIIPALPPGLAPLFSELAALRCPCMVISQSAIVAALLAGQKQRATEAATIVPKTELPESFPDTHPQGLHEVQRDGEAEQRTMQKPQSRISRKRALPWDGPEPAAKPPLGAVKEESFPQTQLQDFPSDSQKGGMAIRSTGAKVKEEPEDAKPAEEHPPANQSVEPVDAGHRPLAIQRASQQAEVLHSQPATTNARVVEAKAEQKQEEKVAVATIQSLHSTHSPDVKAEQAVHEVIVDGAAPTIHPTGTWLKSLDKKGSTRLVVEGVELPRASWTTADKRAPEVKPCAGNGRPNFKRFRKSQGAAVASFVRLTPWVPPTRRLDFETQASLDTRDSQIPNLGM